MSTTEIYIAKDFSPAPAGRYADDGPFNGQLFRESLLLPAVKNFDKVVVNLNDTGGYGSSFLEEAFGGLVRAGFGSKELHQKLVLISERKTYESKVWAYIERAAIHG